MGVLVCLLQISVTIFRSLLYFINVFNLIERKLNFVSNRHLLIFMRLWVWIYGRRHFVPWTLILDSINVKLHTFYNKYFSLITKTARIYKTKLKPWLTAS